MTTPPEYTGTRIYLGEQFVLPLITYYLLGRGFWDLGQDLAGEACPYQRLELPQVLGKSS